MPVEEITFHPCKHCGEIENIGFQTLEPGNRKEDLAGLYRVRCHNCDTRSPETPTYMGAQKWWNGWNPKTNAVS